MALFKWKAAACLLSLTVVVGHACAQQLDYWVYSDFAQGEALRLQQSFIEEFTAKYPDVKITISGRSDDDLLTGQIAGAASGSMPDVFMNSTSYGAILAKAGVLKNIYPDWMEMGEEFRAQFNPELIAMCTPQPEVMYCIPYTGYGAFMYRNLTVLEEAGIDPNQPIKDWDDWKEQMQKLEAAGKNEQKTPKKQKIRSKRDMTCHYCQKPGHFQKNCFKKKKESQASQEKSKAHGSTNEAFAAEVPTNQILGSATQDVWLLDSGASKHMTFRRDWLSNMEPCDNEEVSLGDGGVCKVLGRGTVYIKRLINNQWLDSRLEDVLYVPSLSKNLFSVGACINKNFRVVFNKDSVNLFKGNTLKAYGIKQNNNLFRMIFKVTTVSDANAVSTPKSSLKQWHERLGHINYKYV